MNPTSAAPAAAASAESAAATELREFLAFRLGADQLRPAPPQRAGLASEHLLAIGALDERMLILVDIDKLIGGADIAGGGAGGGCGPCTLQ